VPFVHHRSSVQNWLSGLAGRILCEQSPWCQRKWWICSWLCFLPFSSLSVSLSLGFPCTAYAFLPEHLSNRCQALRRTFPESCTKFDDVPLSDPSRNRIRPHAQLQIKGRKKAAFPPSCVKCYTLTSKIC
jgi:hypothetical protein